MYLCLFAGVEYRRSVGLLTKVQGLCADMYLGWPSFITRHSVLQYVGPLPATCACSIIHPSLRGLATKGDRSVHGFGPASSTRSKTLSCPVPLGMELFLFRACQLVLFLLVATLIMASHCLLLPSRCQHFTMPGKAKRLEGRYFEISQHPDSTVSSSQGAWLATRYSYFPCSRQPASFWNLVGQRVLSLAFLVCIRLLFPVSLSVLPFLQIMVTLRILAVLRFSQEFRQFCLALPLDGERSFEHCPPRTCADDSRTRQLAGLPSSFLSLTIARVLRTGKIARLPSSFLSLTSPSDIRTFRQDQGRRGSVQWSLMAEFGNSMIHWTLLASRLRYAVLGSRVHPRGHLRVCNRLQSVVGREDLMAMAVVRRLLLLLSRAFRAHKTGSLFRVCFNLF